MTRRAIVIFLVIAALARAQSPLEHERAQIYQQLRDTGALAADGSRTLLEELPRLEQAAHEHATPDADATLASAYAALGRFEDAKKLGHDGPIFAALARYDGTNGAAVLAALVEARRKVARDEEVAEAKQALADKASVPLQRAVAHAVLDEWPAAATEARAALAQDPKNRFAKMVLDELARAGTGDQRRARIRDRWVQLLGHE